MSTTARAGSGQDAVRLLFPPATRIDTRSAVCAKVSLGSTDLPRESKLEEDWSKFPPEFTLRCRDARMTAYATICGPNEIVNGMINDVRDCALAGLAAAGLSSIIAGPAAALPAFKAAFEGCMVQKIGERISEISVSLSSEHETGDWGPC